MSTRKPTPPLAGADLARSVRRGSLAVVACQATGHVMSVLILSALLRLLGPEPFGLVGMVLPLVLFGRIFTTGGLYVAGVQQPELAVAEASALFWINQLVGIVTSLGVAALAPVAAWLNGRPELVPLGIALAGTLWATTWGVQHQVMLERELRLGWVALVRVVGQAIGGAAAVAMAWYGWGAWALVLEQYVEWGLIAAGYWWLHPWWPGRPRRGANVLHLIRFGGNYAISGVLFWIAANADKVLIGVLLGERALGLYGQAYGIAMKPVSALSTPLTGVMLPALSRARGDRATYLTLLTTFWRLIALVCFPLGIGLSLTAPEAIELLGSTRWGDAGTLLAVFALLIVVHLFINVIGSVLSSIGRSGRLAVQAAALAAAVLAALAATALWPGRTLLAFASAYTAAYLLAFLPYLGACLIAVEMPWRDFLKAVRRPLLAVAVMAAVVAALRWLVPGLAEMHAAVRLGILATSGAVVYLALVWRELHWIATHLRGPSAVAAS
ncbi:MAG: oligosaccharide flippase family protein [Pirellulales bacterium]|nr:oligosaccharide flippase family protein [Pirellulales bacterium]